MTSSTYNATQPVTSTNTHDGATLLSLFAGSVQRHGDRTAVTCGQARLTYIELDRAAARMASRLAQCNLVHGDIAAIYLDRSADMITALLGVLRRGAAYLPIDPAYPAARVLDTLEDARPRVLITTKELAARLPRELSNTVAFVLLDATDDDVLEDVIAPFEAAPEDVAYVIYTSGSTGKPKGVQVSQHNVVRLIEQTEHWFHFNESDVWTMFHSLAFDFSVWEIWACLATGGRLVIVPFAVSRSPEDFYMLLSDERVTVLNQTPSAFALLMQVEETRPMLPLSLRYVIFGGEALYPKRLRAWFERHGDRAPQLVNMYGITETTVHVSYRPLTLRDSEVENDSLIGVPIPDLQIHVFDAEGAPVAVGADGEMYIGGAGVALGYLNRPQLNAERFIADPYGLPGARLYRTGDLARRRADGELVYLGRGDGQVKINGFRIELGEIESALTEHPDVQHGCVLARPDANGAQRLVAYYVTRNGSAMESSALSGYLATKLPPQMMPSFYMQIATLPLTANGKVDRAALPEPATGSRVESNSALSATEQVVAEAWRAALGAAHIGLDDNFFDIGGTSLLLVAVRARLQEALKRTVAITWMFECTTVRSLAKRLDAVEAPAVSTTPAMTAAQLQAKKQKDAFARIRNTMGATR
ncbi:amino acid adenylation domain-containing protein [Granulicella rosea]|uniref:Amino acid adenylation domain-containing protein n=1 Tax=Granulicella rosea TaxID=474952 RepID=A0A239ETV0_9BACT|nr:amino acid adenylation domain-containing protein [Granulicella rosea]SNS48086.1 amino acid adenylation domain-containing protein [Granulicella rosea]